MDRSLLGEVLAAAACQDTIAGTERAVDAPPARVRPVVLRLLWTGRLCTDLSTPISPASRLEVVTG